MTLVVDASVVVKWLVYEPGRILARELLSRDEQVHAPDLVLVETGNALWKKVRRGEISVDQASTGVISLPRLFESLLPSSALVGRAMRIALEIDHPVYDCLYIACAESLDAWLVTADDRFVRKAKTSSSSVRIYGLSDSNPSSGPH